MEMQGVFLKNPEVPKAVLENLQHENKDIPFYKISDSLVKIPAAWLIEKMWVERLQK